MRNFIKIIFVFCLIFSCSNEEEITNYELIGEFEFNWNPKFEDKNGLNYYIINSSDRLNKILSLENSMKKGLLEKSLEKNDLLISYSFSVSKIMINTKFTNGDDCDYIKAKPVEVFLNTNNEKGGVFFIYKLNSKGKYRIICP